MSLHSSGRRKEREECPGGTQEGMDEDGVVRTCDGQCSALFTRARIRKQPRCPSAEEWMKTAWYKRAMVSAQPQKQQTSIICRDVAGHRDGQTE